MAEEQYQTGKDLVSDARIVVDWLNLEIWKARYSNTSGYK
jgi:hypothetical protein